MKKVKFSLISVLFLSIGLAACSQDEETKKTDDNSSEETAAGQAAIEQGEKVTKTSCISCHGADLTGDLGPDLHNLSLSEDEIVDILVKGREAMPPATAAGQEKEVAAYLMTLK